MRWSNIVRDRTSERCPFRGALPFEDTDDDRQYFFSRTAAVSTVVDLINSARLVVVYGQSGSGKTSLLNAGVLEELRQQELIPAYMRLGKALLSTKEFPLDAGKNDAADGKIVYALVNELKLAIDPMLSAAQQSLRTDLWSTLREHSEKHQRGLVIVLDQFEELFNFGSRRSISHFFDQLALIAGNRVPREQMESASRELAKWGVGRRDAAGTIVLHQKVSADTSEDESRRYEELVRLARGIGDLNVRLLIAIREDYLPQLAQFSDRVPLLLKNSFRISAFSYKEAARAVINTLTRWNEENPKHPMLLSGEALRTLLRFLSSAQSPLGKQAFSLDDERLSIKPTQLQILCRGIFFKSRSNPSIAITAADLGGSAGMQKILDEQYLTILRLFPRIRFGLDPRGWRKSFVWLPFIQFARARIARFCEEGLAIGNGTIRNSMAEGRAIDRFGLSRQDLELLTSRHFVVREARRQTYFYELAHDTLLATLHRAFVARQRLQTYVIIPGLVLFGLLVFRQTGLDVRIARHVLVQRAIDWPKPGALKYLTFRGAKLDLSGEVLTGAHFENATLVAPSFKEAYLNGAMFKGLSADQAVLDGAHLNHAHIISSSLANAGFQGAELQGAKVEGSDLRKVRYTDADISNISLSDTNLNEADFSKARSAARDYEDINLKGSNWWMARGWPDPAKQRFLGKFPLKEYMLSAPYRQEYKERCESTKSGTGLSGASAANTFAWFLITQGGNLDEARRAVAKARERIEEARRSGGDASTQDELKRVERETDDTDAQLKLRLGDSGGALAIYENLLRASKTDPRWDYLRSLAAERTNNGTRLKLDKLQFSPGYETIIFDQSIDDLGGKVPANCLLNNG
jgi:AAA+ ATPase superfamily predicted ATPase